MAYSALPDMRMPYDNDGSVFGYSNARAAGTYADMAAALNAGFENYFSGADLLELQDADYTLTSANLTVNAGSSAKWKCAYLFYPETRETTGMIVLMDQVRTWASDNGVITIQGSTDSTNGVDGSWETASVTYPSVNDNPSLDGWRKNIQSVSFTGGKKTIRIGWQSKASGELFAPVAFHIYGEKTAGQTPDDIIFINHDDTPGVEFTAPEDYGNQQLGTTVTRQFRLKNTSSTKTANTINLQCNDSDFSISENGSTWVTTINISSLSAGAESATLYSRCVTPAPGNQLGPRFARIVVTVASYT